LPINLDDAEAFAQRNLRIAALDGHDSPPWRTGLSRLGVRLATYDARSPIYARSGVGTFGIVNDAPTVYVFDGMCDQDMALTAWHEHSHHMIRSEGLVLACHAEAFCTRYAAAMLAPADSVRRAWKQTRDLVELHALRPATSASVILLRIGDLELAPVALYDRKGPRRAMPDRPMPRGIGKLVDLARREGFAQNENGRAWRLPDNTSRVGVVLAA
jgi:hypothetical protein